MDSYNIHLLPSFPNQRVLRIQSHAVSETFFLSEDCEFSDRRAIFIGALGGLLDQARAKDLFSVTGAAP